MDGVFLELAGLLLKISLGFALHPAPCRAVQGLPV